MCMLCMVCVWMSASGGRHLTSDTRARMSSGGHSMMPAVTTDPASTSHEEGRGGGKKSVPELGTFCQKRARPSPPREQKKQKFSPLSFAPLFPPNTHTTQGDVNHRLRTMCAPRSITPLPRERAFALGAVRVGVPTAHPPHTQMSSAKGGGTRKLLKKNQKSRRGLHRHAPRWCLATAPHVHR